MTSSRSLKSATFLSADWRLSHPKELPGDLPVLLECHTLTINTTVLQLSDAVADISMLQCSAKFRTLITNAHFVADNAYHAMASSATEKPTFNGEEEVVVIRNGWTLRKKTILKLTQLTDLAPCLSTYVFTLFTNVPCTIIIPALETVGDVDLLC